MVKFRKKDVVEERPKRKASPAVAVLWENKPPKNTNMSQFLDRVLEMMSGRQVSQLAAELGIPNYSRKQKKALGKSIKEGLR